MNSAPQLSRIGKYRLIATIGHGGMAHIHLALMAGVAGFNKLLVIKALREDLAASTDDFVTMFLDEARLAARLNHPNIVQSYEVGQAEGRFFIAMEYLEGQAMKTIERRLSPGGLPLTMQLRILSDVAKGLHYAHSLSGFDGEHLGVVHRDVSPHNVLLTYDGQVKLLDFGIAKAANAMHLTKVGVIKGKADYIAPEQIRGDDVDCRADIFSLGVMLWEALAGRRFAGGPDIAEVAKMHNRLTGGEAQLRAVNPEVPERLAQICDRATALDPANRQRTALELSREIDDYLADAALHPSPRQLAELIEPPFHRERAQLRKLIDAQMKLALDPETSFESTTGSLPLLPVPRVSQGSGLWPPFPEQPAAMHLTPTNGGIPTRSGNLPSHLTSTGFPRGNRRSAPWPIVIVVMLIATAFGGLLALRPNQQTVSATATAGVERDASEGATRAPTRVQPKGPAPARSTVHLRIAAEPSTAEATVDGASVTLPFDIEVPVSNQGHEVVISAQGFVPHRALVSYAREQSLMVTLAPIVSSSKRRVGLREAPISDPQGSAAHPNTSTNSPSIAPAPSRTSAEVAPGMDFEKLNAGRRAATNNIVLEEDPYR